MKFAKPDLNTLFENKRTVSLFLVTVLLFLYLFILSPAFEAWNEAREEINQKEKLIQKYEKLIYQANEIVRKFPEISQEKKEELPSSDDQIYGVFLRKLETMIRQNGMTVLDIQILPLDDQDGKKTYLIQVEYEGMLAQMGALLDRMTDMAHPIYMRNLDVERSGGANTLSMKSVFAFRPN